MNVKGSRKDGKSGSPKVVRKSEAGSLKSEEQDSAPDSYRDDIPHSELKSKSDPDNYRDENPKSEIEKPLTTHNSPLTTMEVHHHPEVEKKGLKEYILEGLMIFIAVMMGFFAESLREHINENSRAKEYAITLYSDLKLDTNSLDGYLTYFKNAKKNVDTLMQLLGENDPEKVPSGKLYWFGLYGGAYDIFTPHSATLLEMKSSGSLRFFGDKLIKRKLALYDGLCQELKTTDDKENGIYTEARKARAQLFAFKYNDVLNYISHIKDKKIQRARIDSFQKTRPPLLSYDKTTFNVYVELVRSRFFERKVATADSLRHSAIELIGLLNKKYDLQDE